MADQDTKFRVTYPLPDGGRKTLGASLGSEPHPTAEKMRNRLRQVHETFRTMSEADFAKVTVEEVGQMTPQEIQKRAAALSEVPVANKE